MISGFSLTVQDIYYHDLSTFYCLIMSKKNFWSPLPPTIKLRGSRGESLVRYVTDHMWHSFFIYPRNHDVRLVREESVLAISWKKLLWILIWSQMWPVIVMPVVWPWELEMKLNNSAVTQSGSWPEDWPLISSNLEQSKATLIRKCRVYVEAGAALYGSITH